MRIFLLVILFFFLQLTAYTQDEIVYDTDTTAVQARPFAADKLSNYKKDKNFQYELVRESPKSWWERFKEWFWDKVDQLFSTKEGERSAMIVVAVIAIAILVFFILKLTGMTKVGLFGNKNKGERLNYSLEDENIHTINFENAIQQAVDAGNYRLAVRLLYLQSLKNLTDRTLINWQIDKTNIAYVQELRSTPYQQGFNNLTLQFENNWYGDVPIDRNEFDEVRKQFTQFNRQLL